MTYSLSILSPFEGFGNRRTINFTALNHFAIHSALKRVQASLSMPRANAMETSLNTPCADAMKTSLNTPCADAMKTSLDTPCADAAKTCRHPLCYCRAALNSSAAENG